MPVNLIRDPYQSLPSSSDVSKWVAIHNNVIFRFQRADFTVTASTNSGGNTSLTIGAGSVPSLTVGARVWVSLSSGSVTGYYTIVSNTSGVIVIDKAWTSSQTGIVNVIDDYTNYILGISYESSSDLGATWDVEGTSEHQGDLNYKFDINCSPFLKQTVATENTHTPTAVNEIETGQDKLCRIVITENYINESDVVVSQSAITSQTLVATNAAMQIGATYGENMRYYLSNDGHTVALHFLSDFAEPTQFTGYPFVPYFIYSELMLIATNYDMRETEYVGSTAGSPVGYNLVNANYYHVNKYKMNGSYAAATTKVRIEVKLRASTIFYSDPMYVRLKTCTDASPVCLRWISPEFGVWQYWVFSGNQIEDLNVTTNEGVFSRFISELSTADSDSDFIVKESVPKLTLGCDYLDTNDYNGLVKMLRSPKVQILTNPTTWTAGNDTWQTVKIKSHKLNRETKYNSGSLEFTIERAEHINVRN